MSFYEEKTQDKTEIIETNQKINESKAIEKYKNSINSSVSTIVTIGTNNNINLASIICPFCYWEIFYNKIKEDIINGLNIKCQNPDCSQYFYSS